MAQDVFAYREEVDCIEADVENEGAYGNGLLIRCWNRCTFTNFFSGLIKYSFCQSRCGSNPDFEFFSIHTNHDVLQNREANVFDVTEK